MTTHSLDIDCRGMRCPAPILEVARTARQQVHQPTVLHIYADDDDFPSDLEAWCRAVNARLRWLSPPPEGGFHGLVALHGAVLPQADSLSSPTMIPGPQPSQRPREATLSPLGPAPDEGDTVPSAPPRPPHEPSHPMVMEPPTQVASETAQQPALLDLRGLLPHVGILQLSAALQGQRRGLKILASDPAFRTSLYAWASATCAEISDVVQGEVFSATVRLPLATAGTLVPYSDGHLSDQPTLLDIPTDPGPSGALLPVHSPQADPSLATILVLHNDLESLLGCMLTANAAAAQGMEVVIFFSFWGINVLRGHNPRAEPERKTLLQRIMQWMMPRGPRQQRIGKMDMGGAGTRMMQHLMRKQNVLPLDELMRQAIDQGVRFQVCTMSMGVMGIHRADLMDLPNLEFGGVTAFAESARRSAMSLTF